MQVSRAVQARGSLGQLKRRTCYERVELHQAHKVSAAACTAELSWFSKQSADLLNVASVALQEGRLGFLTRKQDAALHVAHRLAPSPALHAHSTISQSRSTWRD